MLTHRRIRIGLALSLVLTLASCGGGDDDTGADDAGGGGEQATDNGGEDMTNDGETSDDGGDQDNADGGAWFTLDEQAGMVNMDGYDRPIAARGIFTVDGAEYEFVTITCPVPESGNAEDITGFHGVGYDPDGVPFNFNAGAPDLAFNTTYDEDWRSTNTAHDVFSPDWTVSGSEMRSEGFRVTIVETGEKVDGSIVVTCS